MEKIIMIETERQKNIKNKLENDSLINILEKIENENGKSAISILFFLMFFLIGFYSISLYLILSFLISDYVSVVIASIFAIYTLSVGLETLFNYIINMSKLTAKEIEGLIKECEQIKECNEIKNIILKIYKEKGYLFNIHNILVKEYISISEDNQSRKKLEDRLNSIKTN